MPITETQRLNRAKHIGSSDSPALLGVSPYKSAGDVFLEKTGRVEEQPETTPMRYGNLVEEILLRFAEAEIGQKIIRNQFRVADNGIMAANNDALVAGCKQGVEAKSVGLAGGRLNPDEWGEEGTDQIPAQHIVQATHQMICADLEVVWVPVILFGALRMYRVERNADLCDVVEKRALDFWNKNVLLDIPPEETPRLETLKRMKREPGKIVEVAPELVARWLSLSEMAKRADKECESAKAAVIAALGDAEGGLCPLGMLTYMEQNRAGYTVQPTTFRTLRFKKEK